MKKFSPISPNFFNVSTITPLFRNVMMENKDLGITLTMETRIKSDGITTINFVVSMKNDIGNNRGKTFKDSIHQTSSLKYAVNLYNSWGKIQHEYLSKEEIRNNLSMIKIDNEIIESMLKKYKNMDSITNKLKDFKYKFTKK